jgi:hypothetical protein
LVIYYKSYPNEKTICSIGFLRRLNYISVFSLPKE